MSNKFSLFSVFGIESEYMIADKETLKVQPIADDILKELNGGDDCSEVDMGRVSCSNELVNHVLEIKCSQPEPSLANLDEVFHGGVQQLNDLLLPFSCTLLPTAMHPWFNPKVETVLWPHEQREIYNLYNEIFDCKGHGWSNLQSVHINLPYKNEAEFVQLHSAIRITLPLIPFFSASSPFFDGRQGDLCDNRLSFYEKNQIKVPSIIGNIIPERVNSISEYMEILKGIYADISHYKNAKTLQNPWLNSRAAIPKFDDGAIEIRLMDIQESPFMDFALIHLIVEIVKYTLNSGLVMDQEKVFSDLYLRQVYDQSKKCDPQVDLIHYYKLFSISPFRGTFFELATQLIEKFKVNIPSRYHEGLDVLAREGSLAKRMIKKGLSLNLYKHLAKCLSENRPYEG